VFVPVGLNYDRVLEDRVLVAAAGDTRSRFKFRISTVFRYVGRHIWQRVSGKFHRLGFAAVAYGTPLSLRAFLKEPHEDVAKDLGAAVMERVAASVPVMPVPIIAWHLEQAGGQMVRTELEALFERDMAAFEARGLNICLPQSGAWKGMDAALRMLQARGLIAQEEGKVRLIEKHGDLARYYAQSVAHLVK